MSRNSRSGVRIGQRDGLTPSRGADDLDSLRRSSSARSRVRAGFVVDDRRSDSIHAVGSARRRNGMLRSARRRHSAEISRLWLASPAGVEAFACSLSVPSRFGDHPSGSRARSRTARRTAPLARQASTLIIADRGTRGAVPDRVLDQRLKNERRNERIEDRRLEVRRHVRRS